MYLTTKKLNKSNIINMLVLFLFCYSGLTHSEIFFKEDFEKGSIDTSPNPVWSWKRPVSAGNVLQGMYYGPNPDDLYTVSNDLSFTGEYSWRLNFNGRNNWCNQCGSKDITLLQSDINAGCFSASGAPFGDYIYNKTNGFSQWKITDPTSNTVCFNTSTASGDSMFTTNQLNAGDEIKLPLKCGTNGSIGGNIRKRSDCDKAINYLNGASASNLGYGDSISRRFYLYIPSATVLPSITLKLGYSHFRKNGGTSAYTLKLSVQRDRSIELTAPGGKENNPYSIQKNQWYYFEEVMRRETSNGASDGQYDLFVSPAGHFDSNPLVSQKNVQIGELVDMSFNGNFQHTNDASGYLYFDDVLISDGFVGPLNVKIPNPPIPY